MIRLSEQDNNLVVESDLGELAPRHQSQLAFWGFSCVGESSRYTATPDDMAELSSKITAYLDKCGLNHELDDSLDSLLSQRRLTAEMVAYLIARGEKIKAGDIDSDLRTEFLSFLKEKIPRELKEHQIKSALHLLAVRNGANFSVPGSGKTTVVLSVFELLRNKGVVDALFVIGPPSCFGPWRDEYEEVLGRVPSNVTLAGGDIDDRHSKYLADINSACDLYLTSFHTLHRDWRKVKTMFSRQGIRFYVVVDEAHYIKQIDGAWATAALKIASYAERRCILTGTPFPRNYSDSFNLFDFLWPESSPIMAKDKHRIMMYTKKEQYEQASSLLNRSIGALFYRVRKSDLGLAPQVFHEPIMVSMNAHERRVYDAILDNIKTLSQKDYFRDLNLLARLRRGRMMRMRQCMSYTRLLASTLEDYDEDIIGEDKSLASLIHNYDDLERPGKILSLVDIVSELRSKREKIVIWSNFVKTLELIQRSVSGLGYKSHLIYGATPLEDSDDNSDDLTREKIIKEFIDMDSGVDILIANPAACAESISLHKTCSNAIYYDLSYNCAQYLQSLDRIHRVGGSENKSSYYYFLQYEQSLDQDILENIRRKAERMSQIIDQDYPIYSLDMFNEDDELAAYMRLFSDESTGI